MSRRSIHRAWANAVMVSEQFKGVEHHWRTPVPTPSSKVRRKPQRMVEARYSGEGEGKTIMILSIRPSRRERALRHYPKGSYVLK